MKKDYKKFYLRLSGFEGTDFVDLRVSGFGKNKAKLRRIPFATQERLHFIVEVVGFIDEKAKKRNW
jgi:hypothetical protein